MKSSTSDDSSDTDEEESARLKEAILGNASLQLASVTTNKFKSNSDSKKLSKPSLRNQDQFDVNFDEQDLQTTPEFKKFVSKRLSEFIESNILSEDVQPFETSFGNCHGIKLLKESTKFVNIDGQDVIHEQKLPKKKRKKRSTSYSSSSDSEDERSRLAEAAVSSVFIVENASPLQISKSSEIGTSRSLVQKAIEGVKCGKEVAIEKHPASSEIHVEKKKKTKKNKRSEGEKKSSKYERKKCVKEEERMTNNDDSKGMIINHKKCVEHEQVTLSQSQDRLDFKKKNNKKKKRRKDEAKFM